MPTGGVIFVGSTFLGAKTFKESSLFPTFAKDQEPFISG